MRAISIPPLVYLVLAAAAMGLLDSFLPGPRIAPFPWNLAGIAPLALAIALILIAGRSLRKHKTTVMHLGAPKALVTSGAFRVSRNPIYLGFVLVLLGLAALLGSATPCVVPPAFAVFTDRLFVGHEERKLESAFPDAWGEYRKKVRRWL